MGKRKWSNGKRKDQDDVYKRNKVKKEGVKNENEKMSKEKKEAIMTKIRKVKRKEEKEKD